jgi:hypothetical protein
MSQAFRRLSSQVTLIEAAGRILPRDEPQASRVINQVFVAEGIDVRCNTRAEGVWQDADGIHVQSGDDELVGDALLVAVGRRPNVEGLDLEKAGVAYSARGIQTYLLPSQREAWRRAAARPALGGTARQHRARHDAAHVAADALAPRLLAAADQSAGCAD